MCTVLSGTSYQETQDTSVFNKLNQYKEQNQLENFGVTYLNISS